MDARKRAALVVLAVITAAVWIAVWLLQGEASGPGRTAPAPPGGPGYVNHLTYGRHLGADDVPAGEPAWTHTCVGLPTDTGCP
jgi:hypothetical protein